MSSLELSFVVPWSFWVRVVKFVISSGLLPKPFWWPSSLDPSAWPRDYFFSQHSASTSSFYGDVKTTTEANLNCCGEFCLLSFSELSSVVIWLSGLKPSNSFWVFGLVGSGRSCFGLKTLSTCCLPNSLRLDPFFELWDGLNDWLSGLNFLSSWAPFLIFQTETYFFWFCLAWAYASSWKPPLGLNDAVSCMTGGLSLSWALVLLAQVGLNGFEIFILLVMLELRACSLFQII